MMIKTTSLITIFGMAAVTYLTRVGGFWAMNRIKITPRLEAWLKALPGTIVISIVAPQVVTAGLAELFAGLATAVVAWRSKSLITSMAVGVGAVWILRRLLG